MRLEKRVEFEPLLAEHCRIEERIKSRIVTVYLVERFEREVHDW